MDTYVHATDESKLLAVKIFESGSQEEKNGLTASKMA
jgi:hypothetical protein